MDSFKYAFKGLWTLVRTQPNARIHLVASAIVIGAGFFLGVSRNEWLWLTVAMGSVWVTEAMNTALEFITDLVSPEYHPLAGHTKDVAAGAVLLAAFMAIIIACLVFGPYLVNM